MAFCFYQRQKSSVLQVGTSMPKNICTEVEQLDVAKVFVVKWWPVCLQYNWKKKKINPCLPWEKKKKAPAISVLGTYSYSYLLPCCWPYLIYLRGQERGEKYPLLQHSVKNSNARLNNKYFHNFSTSKLRSITLALLTKWNGRVRFWCLYHCSWISPW